MNVARCFAVVAVLFGLHAKYIVLERGVVPCFMRACIGHLMPKHSAVLDAGVDGSLVVHAAFSRREPSHASHRQGDDQQAQEE